MARKQVDGGSDLTGQLEKAIRRSEKLERSLAKIARLDEANSLVGDFLNFVRRGRDDLKSLRDARVTAEPVSKKAGANAGNSSARDLTSGREAADTSKAVNNQRSRRRDSGSAS